MSTTSTRPPTPRPPGRAAREGTFFSRAMRPLNTTMERFIPSSLVFTIVLTFAVAALCLLLTPAGPADVVVGWGDGLSGLLRPVEGGPQPLRAPPAGSALAGSSGELADPGAPASMRQSGLPTPALCRAPGRQRRRRGTARRSWELLRMAATEL